MGILLKFLYRYSTYLKSRIFLEIDKLVLKLIWEYKGLRIAKTDLSRKKKKNGEIIYSDFKTYYDLER